MITTNQPNLQDSGALPRMAAVLTVLGHHALQDEPPVPQPESTLFSALLGCCHAHGCDKDQIIELILTLRHEGRTRAAVELAVRACEGVPLQAFLDIVAPVGFGWLLTDPRFDAQN